MKAISSLYDMRINSTNFFVELTILEYLNLAKDILHKNEFQRRRVRSSKTVYSVLKADLKRGCIMPPIVLALTSHLGDQEPQADKFTEFVNDNKEHLVCRFIKTYA